MTNFKVKKITTLLSAVAIGVLATASVKAEGMYGMLDLGYSLGYAINPTQAYGSGGTYSTSNGDSSTFPSNGRNASAITAESGFSVNAGAGYEISPSFAVDLGLHYRGLGTKLTGVKVAGVNADGSISSAYTFDGKSSVNSFALAPKIHYKIPFGDLSWGVYAQAGVAFNMTDDLKVNSNGIGWTATGTFKGETNTSFTYGFGSEFNFKLNEQLSLGLSAGYTSLGTATWSKEEDYNSTSNGFTYNQTNTYNKAFGTDLYTYDMMAGLKYRF